MRRVNHGGRLPYRTDVISTREKHGIFRQSFFLADRISRCPAARGCSWITKTLSITGRIEGALIENASRSMGFEPIDKKKRGRKKRKKRQIKKEVDWLATWSETKKEKRGSMSSLDIGVVEDRGTKLTARFAKVWSG